MSEIEQLKNRIDNSGSEGVRNKHIRLEKAFFDAHCLLQISQKNRDDEWEDDRRDWLKKWEYMLLCDDRLVCNNKP